jgi:hypothetical protein
MMYDREKSDSAIVAGRRIREYMQSSNGCCDHYCVDQLRWPCRRPDKVHLRGVIEQVQDDRLLIRSLDGRELTLKMPPCK